MKNKILKFLKNVLYALYILLVLLISIIKIETKFDRGNIRYMGGIVYHTCVESYDRLSIEEKDLVVIKIIEKEEANNLNIGDKIAYKLDDYFKVGVINDTGIIHINDTTVKSYTVDYGNEDTRVIYGAQVIGTYHRLYKHMGPVIDFFLNQIVFLFVILIPMIVISILEIKNFIKLRVSISEDGVKNEDE